MPEEQLSQNMSLADLEVKYHTMKSETEHTVIALLASYKERMMDATEFIQKQNQEIIQKDQKINALTEELEKLKLPGRPATKEELAKSSDKPIEKK
jgi:hypothetical protein